MAEESVKQLGFLDDISKELNTTNYTYKSHELICSSYELSITEQRIISLACKKIQPIYIENKIEPDKLDTILNVMKFSQLQITVNEYKREYNIKAKNIYKILKETVEDFFKKKVSYYKGSKLIDKRWISTAGYDDSNGCFYLTFNPDMLKDLLVFKGKYVALFFDMSQNIKSKYAFRIYEILKSNSYLGVYDVSLKDFRFMLKISDDSYSDYSNFNARVIKPNLKAINEYSDIHVEFKPLRNGKSVTHLRFKIKNKPNKIISPDLDFKNKIPKSFAEVEAALKQYDIDFTSKDAERLFNSAVETTISKKINKSATEFILEKISYMKQYALNIRTVDDAIAWLDWAIKSDFIYTKKSVEGKDKKLNFNNFEGREYSEEDDKKLEDALLAASYGYDLEDDPEQQEQFDL